MKQVYRYRHTQNEYTQTDYYYSGTALHMIKTTQNRHKESNTVVEIWVTKRKVKHTKWNSCRDDPIDCCKLGGNLYIRTFSRSSKFIQINIECCVTDALFPFGFLNDSQFQQIDILLLHSLRVIWWEIENPNLLAILTHYSSVSTQCSNLVHIFQVFLPSTSSQPIYSI